MKMIINMFVVKSQGMSVSSMQQLWQLEFMHITLQSFVHAAGHLRQSCCDSSSVALATTSCRGDGDVNDGVFGA